MNRVALNRTRPQILVLIAILSIFIGVFSANASPKANLVLILIPITMIFILSGPPLGKIILPIVMITFPVTISVLGRDAFSTGTFMILLILVWSLTQHRIELTIGKDQFLFSLLALLVCIASVGVLTKTPPGFWGPALRHYLNFISSVAIFILVVHSQGIAGIARSKREYLEKIITAVLLITLVHVILSYVLMTFPSLERYFSVFYKRTQESLGKTTLEGVFARATTIFTRGEEFGELLILVIPLSLYKLFASRGIRYLLATVVLLIAVLLSGTRSAVFFAILQLLIFFFLAAKSNTNRSIGAFVAVILTLIVFFPAISQYLPYLFERTQNTFLQISRNVGLITVLNRDLVWPLAYEITMNTISLFGHGPIQAYLLSFQVYNFHSLYLSLLFQFGIIGTIVFICFLGALTKRLYNTARRLKQKQGVDYLLAIACLLSLTIFTVNEIKFEFNRSDSYQQFVWCIFSVYYMTWIVLRKRKIETKETRNY